MAKEKILHNTTITENSTQRRHGDLSRGSAKYKTCLLPRCGVPTDEGCNQPLSSGPKTYLNTTVFAFLFYISFARNLHKLESLALTLKIHKEARSKEGKQHTQIHSEMRTHTTKNRAQRLSHSFSQEQSSNHLESQTDAQRLSVDDQECSKVAWCSPPCA